MLACRLHDWAKRVKIVDFGAEPPEVFPQLVRGTLPVVIHVLLVGEGTGDAMALITWVVFGAAVIARVAGRLSWEVVLYALLSLTVVRMLPVFLVLTGTNLRTDEKLFIGWFGPRGLASIVFGVIVLNKHFPGGDTIAMTAVCTILLSVVAHGLSAHPLIAALAAKARRSEGKAVADTQG